MPPSRLNDSSSWVLKSRNWLPSTKPHSSSQINIRRVAFSRVWAVGATPWVPFGTGMDMVMVSPSFFFISHALWLLPVILELLCRNLLREQYQNLLFPVEWRAGMSWRGLNNLKMASSVALVTLEKMGAVALLFFSKMVHGVGSTSRYTAHPLSVLLQTSWDPRVGCIQPFGFWGWLPLGFQLFPSIH